MPRPERYNKPIMTPLQVQMHLSSLSKEEITALVMECISRLEIKDIIFETWKNGNALKKGNIEKHLRRHTNHGKEVNSEVHQTSLQEQD